MDVVGFDSDTQVTILRLVSAILHLGNVEFNEESNVAVPVSDNCKYKWHSSKEQAITHLEY